jgi:hypothetical protein
MADRPTTPMDTPHGRVEVPAAPHRLHGADRSGLGDKGWAEVPADQAGHPGDTNVAREFFEPLTNERAHDEDETQ